MEAVKKYYCRYLIEGRAGDRLQMYSIVAPDTEKPGLIG